MKTPNLPHQAWIWLKRLRHRKGYGVHSPFAFNLITWVIYEKLAFYKYEEINKIRKQLRSEGKAKYLNRRKVDELLFRLVNEIQPDSIIEIGTTCGLTTLYLTEAKKSVRCITFDEKSKNNFLADKLLTEKSNIQLHKGDVTSMINEIEISPEPFIDFLYINKTDWAEQAFSTCVAKTHKNSLFVIKGVHNSIQRREWWYKIINDERTGITFDLYDIGLVFFDKQKIKQHYIVNF